MVVTKKKARSTDPALIKLPIDYMRRLEKRFGDPTKLFFILEELPNNRILITPKTE